MKRVVLVAIGPMVLLIAAFAHNLMLFKAVLRTDFSTQQEQVETLPAQQHQMNFVHLLQRRPSIIFFFHIAKTGGTSIRKYLSDLPNVEYHRYLDNYNATRKAMEQHIVSRNQSKTTAPSTLFVEIHGHPIPYETLMDDLKLVRSMASTYGNQTVFSLTVVREPLSLYKSRFWFFHMKKCTANWCGRPRFTRDNMTEENMESVSCPNPQAVYLYGHYLDDWRKCDVVANDDFDEMHQFLPKMFDWIGTTDQLDFSTMPLLHSLMTESPLHNRSSQTTRNSSLSTAVFERANIGLGDGKIIHNQTIAEMLRQRSQQDRYLYDWASRTYVYTTE